MLYVHSSDFIFLCRTFGANLIAFAREWAEGKGFDRVELNMWEFNADALAFCGSLCFETYRRYMELKF